ncbi:MAG: transcriptional repressor NrdR [Alphaproteobacteria bacterium]|jgi:transcriptional repressor NrdR|nr:transcriptional repressor NrdR [Alphaproteobacteria bacterium]MBT5257088.1 transcriptional repressor NrdR [Alphaproteobacteria bacterium]MBT5482201.1 transcriptional repressor NrdR [Alphaproteobacteria bacterium]MBT5728643.1 transcriptional repressor NrdR [Alphaproteobacteria bacterium]MDA7775723.1 transcriptional regulator NrdR [Alphaproteobacteria bacterium]|tara:strand:+ start:1035 stop:1484 length:450 start_codon:yes stop_codon:yes gene_type:complete
MLCPFCRSEDTQVKDSRPSEDGASIRRRRQCGACDARFTTFERVQLREISVMKRDGRKVIFSREKLERSFTIALRKRAAHENDVAMAINEIVRKLESTGEADVTSDYIGSLVMKALLALDKVGYIRYASVYKNFEDAGDFEEFVNELRK